MTSKEATRKGYVFTGIYNGYGRKEETKAEAAKIRKLGFKACVTDDDGCGTSVYAEKDYNTYKNGVRFQQELNNIESTKNYYYNKYLEALKEVEEREAYLTQYLETIKEIMARANVNAQVED